MQSVKKPRRVRCVSSEKNLNHFLPGRTPGWLLLPLRGNSPPVPGRKYISGCKCGASRSESNGTIASGNCSIMYGICSPMANKLCAQQTAKTGGKARRSFSTSSIGAVQRTAPMLICSKLQLPHGQTVPCRVRRLCRCSPSCCLRQYTSDPGSAGSPWCRYSSGR